MWRAFFLAVGISLLIIGAQCLIVERVHMSGKTSAAPQQNEYLFGRTATEVATGRREISPPDWAPWSLMSAGAVVIIYSFTIPKRVSS